MRMLELDVRPVEPKDRYATIMAAYDSLPAGATMELTVDHDPQCMYYTLLATRGDAAFTFDYLESGPENWVVLVGKRTDAKEEVDADRTRTLR